MSPSPHRPHSVEATDRVIYSFVIDANPIFSYQGWHLARSLIQHCGGNADAIHVQCTPEVDRRSCDLFRGLGCHVHRISRFGDGRHCNKLNQLDSLRGVDFDRVALLDADMIAVADLRPFLGGAAILGKIVDLDRPPLPVLDEIATAAGMSGRPPVVETDATELRTYLGNCNGGFYAVPKAHCERLSVAWRRWALWLIDHIEPLRGAGREKHVDQVSFWLALHMEGLPFELAPSNVNYFIHFAAAHRYFDPTRPIALLHYHGVSLNDRGQLVPRADLGAPERDAIAAANEQIGRGLDERLLRELQQHLKLRIGR
jgi:hypothetical protein